MNSENLTSPDPARGRGGAGVAGCGCRQYLVCGRGVNTLTDCSSTHSITASPHHTPPTLEGTPVTGLLCFMHLVLWYHLLEKAVYSATENQAV